MKRHLIEKNSITINSYTIIFIKDSIFYFQFYQLITDLVLRLDYFRLIECQ